jgi:hypothetical protein
MKQIKKFFSVLALLLFIGATGYAQKNYMLKMTLHKGQYLFNTTDLYFFDDGIDCYLIQKCRDVDTVFSDRAIKVNVSKDSTIKYQAYLFTDTYEYVYTKINKTEGWLRVDLPLTDPEKNFLKAYLKSTHFKPYSCYVEIIPFKNENKIFISTQDDWYIGNLLKLSAKQIGTKGGRLEACQMVYSKNCVKCYIDLGWGQEVWYDQNGKKKKVR